MKRPLLHAGQASEVRRTDYTCPHCGVLQASTGRREHLGAILIQVFQCVNCRDVEVALVTYERGDIVEAEWTAFPFHRNRIAKIFVVAPPEVETAYNEACALFGVHTGASGAYARRALELILDNAGYPAKNLADSIKLARAEPDPDKRLPKRLLQKLDYIREIGNFALHVRRDDELTIVPIDAEEVSTCLETIEDLISQMFEEPVAEYRRTLALNEKLRAAGKKEIELPDLPLGVEAPVLEERRD
jgi:hypothetical protein